MHSCYDASSKLFLIDILLKGNSVRLQGLEGTSLLTTRHQSNVVGMQRGKKKERERAIVGNQPYLLLVHIVVCIVVHIVVHIVFALQFTL